MWLAVVALPLHGFAGGAMSSCLHMRVPQSVSLDAAGMSLAHAAMPMAQGPAAQRGCDAMAGDLFAKSLGKCAPSAACSSVAAPIVQPPVFVAAALSAPLPLAPLAPGFAFFTGAPERPPRS